MAQKFKVGDLVYCRFFKENGIVLSVYPYSGTIDVRLFLADYTASYTQKGELLPDKKISLKKIKTFTPKDMLDFANYCISEGFTSNATSRDLVRFLNSRKEVNYES